MSISPIHIRILFFFLLVVLPLKGSTQEISDSFMKGYALFTIGEYAEAMDPIERAISLKPDDYFAIFLRAECNYELGNYQLALNDLERVNELKPDFGTYLEAKSLAKLGDINGAAAKLTRHLASPYRKPPAEIQNEQAFQSLENSRLWVNIWKDEWYTREDYLLQETRYLIRNESYIEGLEQLDQAVAEGTGRDVVHYCRALLFESMGNTRSAMQELDKAISLNSLNDEYFITRARVALQEGNPDRARTDLTRVLRSSPHRLDLYRQRGIAYGMSGMFEAGVEDLEYFLKFQDKSDAGWYELGKLYASNQKYLDAIPPFNRAIDINPGIPAYYTSRGDAYAAANTPEYALKDFSMALDLDPYDPETNLKKGLVRFRLGDRSGACEDWNNAARYGSKKAIEYLQRNCQ